MDAITTAKAIDARLIMGMGLRSSAILLQTKSAPVKRLRLYFLNASETSRLLRTSVKAETYGRRAKGAVDGEWTIVEGCRPVYGVGIRGRDDVHTAARRRSGSGVGVSSR